MYPEKERLRYFNPMRVEILLSILMIPLSVIIGQLVHVFIGLSKAYLEKLSSRVLKSERGSIWTAIVLIA